MNDSIMPIVDTIKKRGYDAFEDIIAKKEAEKFFVDFKQTEKDDYGNQKTLFNSDKNNLAKAISGFGNSEGGVIIWGIDASGSCDDYAKAMKPIEGVDNLVSLLESFVSLSTLPSHKTVESFAVKKTDSDTNGLAVTVVPKGNDLPYQNINDYKYYMRAGSSFHPIPHGVLQGMFGRAPQPDVFWMFNAGNMGKHTITGSKGIKWQIGLMAVNNGLGIAEDVYGFIRGSGPNTKSLIINYTDLVHYDFQSAYGMEISFISKQGFRMGYEQKSQMMTVDLELLPPFKHKLYIELMIGARNQQIYRKIIEKEPRELDEIYKRAIDTPEEYLFSEIWDSPSM